MLRSQYFCLAAVFPEFFDLIRFPCKGFDGADTGEIFLCNGIHDSVFLADRIVDTVEFFFEADCDACDERKDRHGDECQRQIQFDHTDHCHHDTDQAF